MPVVTNPSQPQPPPQPPPPSPKVSINYDQATGIIRAVVPPLVAYAAAKGWLGNQDAASVGAAIVTLLTVGWSLINNQTGKTIT